MGQTSQKLLITLIISLMVPCALFAQDNAENGSSFSFKSLLNGLFSSHSSTDSSNSTQNSTETRGSEISNKIIDRFDGSGMQQQQIPQNNYVSETQERIIREGLVRCLYLGKFVEIHTGLAEQDSDAQVKAKRAGELYANLQCNQQLAGYEQIWKGVDQAIGNCMANDDCQNLNPDHKIFPAQSNTGGVKTLPVPTMPTAPTASVGGIK